MGLELWQQILICLLIFIGKNIEVTVAVFRTVLITKGERKVAVIVSFFEVILWVIIVAYVISDITLKSWFDFVKILAYSLGFASGQFLGSWLEDQVGLGTVKLEVIIPFKEGDPLADYIRKHNYAVTELIGEGKEESQKKILIIYLKRKEYKRLIKLINNYTTDSVITLLDIKPVYGGYRRLKKKE